MTKFSNFFCAPYYFHLIYKNNKRLEIDSINYQNYSLFKHSFYITYIYSVHFDIDINLIKLFLF